MGKIQKILVPIDFSDESARALRYALSLATETKGEVVVLHVVEKARQHNSFAASLPVLEGSPFLTDDCRPIPVDLLLRERALDLWNFIQTAIRHNGPVRITRKLRMGSLIKEIAAVAEKENIDLIVLELRKRFPFAALAVLKLLKMIGRLPCPVLLDSPVDKHAGKAKKRVVSLQLGRTETIV